MRFILIISFLVILVSSCEVKPVEIQYGKDGCHFCSMTIVDNQHAAQILNDKGKAFKYDAIECMLNDLKKRPAEEIGMIVVNDYNNPGDLINAEQATYLISEAIPSPMGAFLSAGINQGIMTELKDSKGGTIYSWTTIKEKFKVN